MKKNGFTLVELLAVIIIISAIMTLLISIILETKSNTQTAIFENEIKAIKEATKLLALDLDDYSSDIYNCKSESWVESKCEIEPTSGKWISLTVTVNDLKKKKYLEDNDNTCSGKLTIYKSDYDYNIELNTLKCK